MAFGASRELLGSINSTIPYDPEVVVPSTYPTEMYSKGREIVHSNIIPNSQSWEQHKRLSTEEDKKVLEEPYSRTLYGDKNERATVTWDVGESYK